MGTWPTTKTSYTAGHFELALDGSPTTAYLKSVDGGFINHALIDERIGPENMSIKHASVADIEPISFEFGMAGSSGVLKWIQDSWRKNYGARSGQITHANFNLQSTYEHAFSDALITETTFPTLDGASKEAAYMKVKCQPAAVATKKVGGQKLSGGKLTTKQKLWMCSGFRLNIDGIDDIRYTNKIDSFTIKQGVKKMYTGPMRFPELTPTKIDFPNLTGTISLEFADGVLDWYQKYVASGKKDPSMQKSGSIEFLSPARDEVLFRVNLYWVSILKAQIVQSTANSDQIKRVKFELYVGNMDIDGKGELGME